MEKVSKIAGEIRAIETPISETDIEKQSHKPISEINLEKQPHKPDWVEIENEKHNLEMRSKDKDFERILQELHTEAEEESNKYGWYGYKLFAIFIIVYILILSLYFNL